jgi:hypothetical protein
MASLGIARTSAPMGSIRSEQDAHFGSAEILRAQVSMLEETNVNFSRLVDSINHFEDIIHWLESGTATAVGVSLLYGHLSTLRSSACRYLQLSVKHVNDIAAMKHRTVLAVAAHKDKVQMMEHKVSMMELENGLMAHSLKSVKARNEQALRLEAAQEELEALKARHQADIEAKDKYIRMLQARIDSESRKHASFISEFKDSMKNQVRQ